MNKNDRIMIIEVCGTLDTIIDKLSKSEEVRKCAAELKKIKERLLKNK